MDKNQQESILINDIKNGSSWMIALFPVIFLIAEPWIAAILLRLDYSAFRTLALFLFIEIWNIAYLWVASNSLKGIGIPAERDFGAISWMIPGVFLYRRAALIQKVYGQRLPYVESMWWIWLIGLIYLFGRAGFI